MIVVSHSNDQYAQIGECGHDSVQVGVESSGVEIGPEGVVHPGEDHGRVRPGAAGR